jgi:hypothetical protein
MAFASNGVDSSGSQKVHGLFMAGHCFPAMAVV